MSKNAKSQTPKAPAPALLEIGTAERVLAAHFEVDLQAPEAVLLHRIGQDAETGLRLVITMGLRLMALKECVGHGEFESRLEGIGISPREAQKSMQTARVFALEDDPIRRDQILRLGKSKGMALLAAAPEKREAILSDPELSIEAAEAKTREFEAMLRAEKKRADKLQRENNDQAETIKAMTRRRFKSDLDPATQLVRIETQHHVATVDYVGAALKKAMTDALDEAPDAPERQMRLETLWMAAHAAAAEACQALYDVGYLVEQAGLDPDALPTQADSTHLLSPDEAAAWREEWATIRAGMAAKDEARRAAAQADLPRSAGRPKGSKNKAGA